MLKTIAEYANTNRAKRAALKRLQELR